MKAHQLEPSAVKQIATRLQSNVVNVTIMSNLISINHLELCGHCKELGGDPRVMHDARLDQA